MAKPTSLRPASSPPMKWISASASLPAGVRSFVAENLDCDVHDVPPRKWPDRGGPGLVFTAAMPLRVRDPSCGEPIRFHSQCCSVFSPTSTGSAGAKRCRRFAVSRALPGQLGAVHEDEPRRCLRARGSSAIGSAAMPDTSESGAVWSVTVAGASSLGGCGGDERVIKARLSSDRHLDAGRVLSGRTWIPPFVAVE